MGSAISTVTGSSRKKMGGYVSARQNLLAQAADFLTRASASLPLQVPTVTGKATDAWSLKGRHDRMSAIEASETPEPLGHELVGHGPAHVIVLNDWLCDTSTWDGARRYLDEARFTFAFAELRGYGRSRSRAGTFTVEKAAHDTLVLADVVGWDRFAVVGHSMSSLVALHLAQHHADRIERVVLLTPPPPSGFGADDAMIDASRALALADDATRLATFAQRFGGRLSAGWAHKASRWRKAADPAAAAGYVSMFASDGVPARPGASPFPCLRSPANTTRRPCDARRSPRRKRSTPAPRCSSCTTAISF